MFGIDDAALAIMLAGGISAASSLYTNKKNRESQENANAINWEIARQNNATQIEMANTAHQREVRDLRRAGLNPILSAGGSGASTPTLQAPTIDPVHTDNAFEGLANSAKGLTRYLGEQYRQQQLSNEAVSLDNEGVRLDNAALEESIPAQKEQARADLENASADHLIAQARSQAAKDLVGDHMVRGKDGVFREFRDPAKFNRLVGLQREALESELKMQANSNWRANLSSFTPFVSPAAINSASSALRGTHSTRRRYTP